MNISFEAYKNCTLCPRECHVDRTVAKGFCGAGASLYVARAALHMWEEPCISGTEGSGAVFFSGCNLHCVYCQNSEISGGLTGKEITVERLSQIFLELQAKKANNINLVTGGHYIPHIISALDLAKENGLNIPIVYNTSSYEKPSAIEQLKGYVDVFLPDYKYTDSNLASLYSKAPNYPETAANAISKMLEITGKPVFDSSTGLIQKGVIVRVLVLPEHTRDAINSIRYLYSTFQDDIYISIMSQYTPILSNIPEGKPYECLKRPITHREYDKVVNSALDMGIKNAFIQEGKVCSESFIPAFDNEGV